MKSSEIREPLDSTFMSRLDAALKRAQSELLSRRNAQGHWSGKLSTSALSTATAVTALAVVDREREERGEDLSQLQWGGIRWLADHQNADGGWGDTTLSFSNISTTALCWAAFGAVEGAERQHEDTVRKAEQWLMERAGSLDADPLADAIISRYGNDRTFSVPILTMCALAGRLGQGRDAWRRVISLPFELAACPPEWFARLRLPVVSYALPALIAIGQARHHHRPSRNPAARLLRTIFRRRTLNVLKQIQPSSGGFLEATPLTSFVVMSLAGSGEVNHPVTQLGVEFLIESVRPDGSWPIDTNLATWVTTHSVNALAHTSESPSIPGAGRVREWLLSQQYREIHPYTQAPPGAWAWTDLPGGVPDGDDTPGALLALRHLSGAVETDREAAAMGVRWLLNLQNRDGGIPTFCRGWGKLPFDRSSSDLTAHAIRAWLAWRDALCESLQKRIESALEDAVGFLIGNQQSDGSWNPLWFGNQHVDGETNPTYGTARVLVALAQLDSLQSERAMGVIQNGANWLIQHQNVDGGWGGARGTPTSVEETALGVEALASLANSNLPLDETCRLSLRSSLRLGASWLMDAVEGGRFVEPSPIGFYFAKLWYYEELYPVIYSTAALGLVKQAMERHHKMTNESRIPNPEQRTC